MDPFTLATGVAGLLNLSSEIVKITKEYVRCVKSAPEEIHDLGLQANALSDVLGKLMAFLRSDAAERITFQPDSQLYLILEHCRRQLESLCKKLKDLNAPNRSKFSSALDRLKWPLEKKECMETSRHLRELAQTFHFCLTVTNWCV
jgi:hypothetical protein